MSDLKQQIEQALTEDLMRQAYLDIRASTVSTLTGQYVKARSRIVAAIMPIIEAKLPPETPPSAETWPRIIAERDGLRLQQTQPPNSYLDVIRISDGKELVSQPCVVTEPKDDIIFLLLHAWKAALSSPRRAGFTQREVLNMVALAYTDIEDVRVETLVDMLRAYAELLPPAAGKAGE